ncbi:MAG: magnesium transporter [Oceanicoccus sp.]|uniref:NAD/FAD-utilizing enzyme n=1 Tax=Oceanicoccus sp. TaxID=2691044 RepID=UPI002610BC29|nr:NAD/FAD-utilizing enzyme [Oceanicoccus sp.]MCP3906718.1 magnesium transporter [Oceanicoccus sp.]MDG1772436.1 NAD/FAD-utilizing enzyme [Oceanicoccus sp.]
MKRHFYISKNLDDLEAVEHELEDQGVATPQIHVLSQNDADVQHHHLNEVEAVLKKDVVHSMELGAIVGVVAAILVLAIAYFAGWTESAAGWIPFIFLAIVVLGFCTWEGGLFGIQEPHYQFKQFQDTLKQGKHILFVDVTEQQETVLARIVEAHPQLEAAGEAESTPEWVVEWQKNWKGFVKTMP